MTEVEAAGRRVVLVRNTFWNQGAQLTRMLSQFILLPFFVARLGPTLAGIYFLAISFTAYFGILDSSFAQPLVKFVAEYRATGELDLLRSSVRAVFRVYLCVGAIVAAALVAAGLWGTTFLKVPPDQVSVARATFIVAGLAALPTWPLTTFDNVLRGAQRFDLVAKVSIAVTAVAFAAQIGAVLAGLGPPVMMLITLGTLSLGMVVSRWLARRTVPEIKSGPGAAGSIASRLWGFSWRLILIGVTDIAIYQLDRTVVAASAGVAAVVIYEFAARFHKVPRDLHSIAVSAAMPAASELDAQGDRERLGRLMVDGTRFTVAVVLPVTVAILALGRPLTSTYAPPEAYAPLMIFVSYWILNANTGVPSVIIAGMGRLNILLVYSYAVAALNLLLSLVLARRYGVAGVVAGTTLSYAITFPIFLVIALRLTQVSFGRYVKRAWWPAYPMAIVLAGVLLLVARLPMRSFVLVVLAGATGVAAYLGAFWFWATDPGERRDFVLALTGRRDAMPTDSVVEEEMVAAVTTDEDE